MKKLVKQVVETYNQDRPHGANYTLIPNQMSKIKNIKFREYKKTVAN
ncbi:MULTISPECIES: hypothetical protein [unclassified Myroides]